MRVSICCCVLIILSHVHADHPENSILGGERIGGARRTPMHKALLTQRGYIQFLRWELPVPDITEFTFCLWVKSANLTYAHSIFSYSKDEKDRLVSAWITDQGRSVSLEIGGVEVFREPAAIRENRWYHVCESWESGLGRYAMWIDGRIQVQGHAEKTIGHTIPKGGDVVLGQEYTDFDKGLEEGIEGAVLGFNLLLASAFSSSIEDYDFTDEIASTSEPAKIPKHFGYPGTEIRYVYYDEALRVGRSSVKSPERDVRGRREVGFNGEHATSSIIEEREPLGLRLVKLSYARCEIGRGSPYIGGPLMLISWSRTPVKVFGGAIIKNVEGQCGVFV